MLVISSTVPVSDLSLAPKHQDANRPIYLDAQSTTPVDPRVLDAMMPFLTNQYGNPHSRTHAYGWESEAAVEVAREHVGALIGADSKKSSSPQVPLKLITWQSKGLLISINQRRITLSPLKLNTSVF